MEPSELQAAYDAMAAQAATLGSRLAILEGQQPVEPDELKTAFDSIETQAVVLSDRLAVLEVLDREGNEANMPLPLIAARRRRGIKPPVVVPPPDPPVGLELYNGGDPNFGGVTLRAVRWNDEATMLADMNGTNPNNNTSWDATEGAVRHYFPNGNGTLDAQLRYYWGDDGGATRLEVFLQTKHGSDWANYASSGSMPTHKSLQLAIAGSVISEQRFTTRDRYWGAAQGDGSICYVDVRDVASVGEQPKGPSDGLKTPTGGVYTTYHKKRGLWYLYQWAIDYGVDSRAYSLSVTEEGGTYYRIYNQQDLPNWDRVDSHPQYNLIAHINEFWSEWNSSQASSFVGPSTIHVKDLRVHY